MNTARRLFTLGLVAATVFAGTAQAWSWSSNSERINGNGDIATEARDTGAFDGVATAGGFNILIRQGTGTKVEVKADRNLLPYIETRVVDGGKGRTLQVEPKKGYSINASTSPSLTIEMPALRAVSVAGSGAVKVEAMKTAGVDASIAGSGDVKAADLVTEDVKVTIVGSGDAQVNATKTLHVSIAGSGDVKYAGSPEISSSIAGSGKVRRIGQ